MIIKILFSSALTLHRPWPPILISVLFHPGLFQVLGRSFLTLGVFELDFISFLFAYVYNNIDLFGKQHIARNFSNEAK